MARERKPSPLKGCFSSLATRTQAVVAKSGLQSCSGWLMWNLAERATEDERKKGHALQIPSDHLVD